MAEPIYSVKALDESTWPAFASLVEHNNGVFGGCWCMGFHPEGSVRTPRRRSTENGSSIVFGRERPTRRSFSTGRIAWGGASSVPQTSCRG